MTQETGRGGVVDGGMPGDGKRTGEAGRVADSAS